MSKGKTVFVGLSGGVDSSVAALRLKQEGYSVVGVFIKVWHPDFLVCNWEQERLDAMRVAAKLDIPFLTCDAEQAYKDDVADYFIGEYKAGRTPNPDVMCNKHVKFGAFFRFAEENGADYIATGHYAQRITTGSRLNLEPYELHRGVDTNKDQTYFLWALTQTQLQKILFPVGNSPKKQIRKEAKNAGLITAAKKDSQGICFLGHVDIPEFLSHYVDLQYGDVLSEQGEVIGSHKGALVYTNGQRHGFTITTNNTSRTALYVTARDIEANTITVSEHKRMVAPSNSLTLDSVNCITYDPKPLDELEIQIRYRQTPVLAKVLSVTEGSMKLTILGELDAPSSGQSCVLYDGDTCLGGGIIAE